MSIIFTKHDSYPESILIRKLEGYVGINEILYSWEYLIKNNMIHPKIKGIINDIRACDLGMDMDGFKIVLDYLKDHEVFKNIRLAVICINPKMIIFPIFGENTETELGIKTFSTEEAAVEWVLKNPNA